MALDVHIHVAFACDHNGPLAELAARHAQRLREVDPKAEDYGTQQALWFLDDLSQRTGDNPGSKGGLALWGMVLNGNPVEEFVQILRPFWEELLAGYLAGLPLEFERVIVFEEVEQSEAATAYQICWDDPHSDDRKLVITVFPNLPFCWGQY